MSGNLPAMVDPFRLAADGARIQGELDLEQMGRLKALCQTAHRAAQIDLVFGRGADKRSAMRGHIDIELGLVCQRCLGPMAATVSVQPNVIFGRPGEPSGALQEGQEFVEVDGPFCLAEMVEDELILALPMMPRHSVADCAGFAETAGHAPRHGAKPSPFAALAGWQGGKK